MSHSKERSEKVCLNCNAQVYGTFCHICGQENIEPKESVWHLVNHYFQDITHFDGKFFSTIRLLIFKPGFLSAEYARGRRVSYLNPIRMYVFTSAIFFLIFFSFIQKDEEPESAESSTSATGFISELKNKKDDLQKSLDAETDSTDAAAMRNAIAGIDKAIELVKIKPEKADSITNSLKSGDALRSFYKYSSPEQYDSAQLKLSAAQRDGWFNRKMQYKMIAARKKYNNNSKKIQEAVIHKFRHSFPQLLFLSLPFFAFILKILYIRRKQFYYVNHIILTIHIYCAIFILLLVQFGINVLQHQLHWGIFSWIQWLLGLGLFYYAYKSMRNFYQQGRSKTITKFLILNFSMCMVIAVLALIMLIFSAYQI